MAYLQLQNKKLWPLAPITLAVLFLVPRFANKLLADSFCPSNFYSSGPNATAVSQIPNNPTYGSRLNINIGDDFFSPKSLSVMPGTTVTWTNNGSMTHTVMADDGSFDSGTLNPGQSFSRTFNTQAIVPYHCRFHGAAGGVGMSGALTINGSNQTFSGGNAANNNAGANPTAAAGTFSLTADKQQYCLGQTPTYTVRASASWANQSINWTSLHNGQTSNSTFVLDSSGNWSQQGHSWQAGDEGAWQKTALVNGQSQSISLTVQNCGTNLNNNQTGTNGGNNVGTNFFNAGNAGSVDYQHVQGISTKQGVSVGSGWDCLVSATHECLY